MHADPADRLAARTLELVDVPSESRAEQEIAEVVARAVPLPLAYRDEETLLYAAPRTAKPLVVLAGHLDTVPAQANIPGRIEDGRVHGLGASDMKGGLAVMIELARWAAGVPELAVDLAFLFFPREEISVGESPLPALFDTGRLDDAALVIVLEPTDNAIHAGCLGNLNVRLTFRGVSAHSARPWTGVNAIARAVAGLAPVVALEPIDVEVQGLVFRETATVTRIAGGIADNIVPAEATATLNVRYPPGRTAGQALERIRAALTDEAELEVLNDSPPARVALDNPLVERLTAAGSFAVEPKQAWTPVAQFAERGLDAVNLGPGATRYAHREDEQIEASELARTYEALRRFAAGSVAVVRLSPVLDRLGAYPFARLDAARAAAEARGVEVIDFGMGDPSEPPEPEVERALVEALPLTGGYPRAPGLPELRNAIAGWAGRRFGVDLDPDREIVPTLGSKELIFSLPQLLLDRGAGRTVVAYTEPGYPVYERGALFAGGEALPVPLLESNGFLPDLDAVDWDGVALLWVNYPNNPTGAVAPLEFYERAAELARRHDFVLASDEAYTELWFDEPPASALQLADRRNVLVLNTLSKRSSMTGYRSGFAAGDPELTAALRLFRPSTGTAPQEFVQRASIVAWADEAHVERTRARYAAKREVLMGALTRAGVELAGSAATMYVWARVPGNLPSEEFATALLEHGVLVSPGAYFGASGEGYFRLALVPGLDDCRRAAAILEEVL